MSDRSMGAAMAPSLYQPLDTSRREIRLLQVHPGTSEEIVSVTLWNVPLPPIPIDFIEQLYFRELRDLEISISSCLQQGQTSKECELGRWKEVYDALDWLFAVRRSVVDTRKKGLLIPGEDFDLGMRSDHWRIQLPEWLSQLDQYETSLLSLLKKYGVEPPQSNVGPRSGSLETENSLSYEEPWSTVLQSPIYEAVSYCWGNTKTRNEMLLNGASFRAPSSAVEVLRHFRYPYKHRTLWIDAICINQDDNKERETQVTLMYDVYSNSARTLVWLGHEDDQTKYAIWLLRAIARTMEGENHSTLTTSEEAGPIEQDFHAFATLGITTSTGETSGVQLSGYNAASE